MVIPAEKNPAAESLYLSHCEQPMHSLHDKLKEVHDRMQRAAEQAERPADEIALLAVSKTQAASAIRALHEAGQRVFGESYVQEALAKQAALTDLDIEWHFIGPVQSNKTRAIASHFNWVHSVDRLKIAQRLSDQRSDDGPPLNICLQVNLDRETSKRGVPPDQVAALAEQVLDLPRLVLRGLMVIPAPRDDFSGQFEAFSRARALFQDLQASCGGKALDTLSMGMSGDLEAAVAAGSTMVRVGTDLFGKRNT